MKFENPSLEELRKFIEPEIRRKIYTLLLIKPFSVYEISRIIKTSPQYVDRTLKFMEAKKWIISKEGKVKSYYASSIFYKVFDETIAISEEAKKALITMVHNPLFIFFIVRGKKIFELIEGIEKSIKNFILASTPDFLNPLEGLVAIIYSLSLFRHILTQSLTVKKEADLKKLILEDPVFKNLIKYFEKVKETS